MARLQRHRSSVSPADFYRKRYARNEAQGQLERSVYDVPPVAGGRKDTSRDALSTLRIGSGLPGLPGAQLPGGQTIPNINPIGATTPIEPAVPRLPSRGYAMPDAPGYTAPVPPVSIPRTPTAPTKDEIKAKAKTSAKKPKAKAQQVAEARATAQAAEARATAAPAAKAKPKAAPKAPPSVRTARGTTRAAAKPLTAAPKKKRRATTTRKPKPKTTKATTVKKKKPFRSAAFGGRTYQ